MTRLRIGLSLSPTWLRGDAWRRDDSRVEELFDASFTLDAARAADAARLDFVFKPDALTLDPTAVAHGPGFASLESIVLMTAVAAATTHVGVIPTVSTTFGEPFSVARQLQSLDHLSHGRLGWNAVTSLGGAENFGGFRPDDPYADAHDFVAVIEGLRSSFPAAALVRDRASGQFADADALRTLAPRGRHNVRGPLPVPARTDERLPMLHAGGSAASVEFAAHHADAVFAMAATSDVASAQRTALRATAARAGRPAPLLLPGLALYLADTASAAADLAADAGSAPAHVRHWTIAGTPDQAAAQIIERADDIDGFIALPGGSWRSLELFTEQVVPRLVAAGLFPDAPATTSLASRLREDSPS